MADLVLEGIAKMRDRPAIYIGEYSANAMFLFLAGYVSALRDHTKIELTIYHQFIEGLYDKYGRGGGGHSWAWVLGQRAGGDAAALDLFFRELEEFRQRL